jgi:hypothetical protein
MARRKPEPEWEDVLAAAARFQQVVIGSVLVGGTAVAIHLSHRRSFDADHVITDLKSRFEQLVNFLEQKEEWVTTSVAPGKIILGNFMDVETGLRQLRRQRPLETTTVKVDGQPLVVPTVAELIRVKAWLALDRNTVRDYLDLAAMTRHVGAAATWEALEDFDAYYADIYRADAERDVSPLLQLVRQLAEPRPADLEKVDLSHYKGVVEPWTSWDAVAAQCRQVSTDLASRIAST